ncbi:MAG TPA: 3-oxoadipate enol-lactonase [Candidatus Dormibacteraeota bacterium]|nr:3-oxoadipate enol-lactonase [Candidatus Dormibacteraeota bacterium]
MLSSSGLVAVPGSHIHYRIAGKAAAPVLVLSHALGTDLSLWEPQMPVLASCFRVLRCDGRGHGQSPASPGDYTIELLASDLLAVLDHLRIDAATFCGLSLGGMVGLWLGIFAPTRVPKLALGSTAAHIGSAETWNARIDSVRKGGMAAVTEATLERWFTPPFIRRDPAAVDRIRQMLLASPTAGYIANCAAVRDANFREVLGQVRSQTLVISGSHDRSTPPADGRFLAEHIPGASYCELDAAHLSNIESSQNFTATILQFMTA